VRNPTSVQLFASESAALASRFEMFLVEASCQDASGEAIRTHPACFDPQRPYRSDACSYVAPRFCAGVIAYAHEGAGEDLCGRRRRGKRHHR
jgi:hypothetical protein